MAGLIYRIPFRNVTLGANGSSPQDLWELVWPSGVAITIHKIHVESQYNVDERIDLALMTRTGTGSGGSSAITPLGTGRNLAGTIASGITSFKTMVTTPGSGGALYSEAMQWSALGTIDLIDTPEDRIELPASGGHLVLNNSNVFVAANRVISGWLITEER